jgi:hypothetical protein
MRMDAPNQLGVLANVSKCFARNDLNISEVIQRPNADKSLASIVFMTGPAKPKVIQKALDELVEAKIIVGKPIMLRVERSPEAEPTNSDTLKQTSKIDLAKLAVA